MLLKIENLRVSINGKKIIKGLDLQVNEGEVHAIMGPNGTGKSTLASVIAGKEMFEVTDGTIEYNGRNLMDLPVEDRSREGIFLGFQYPVEIPGVSMTNFMKTAIDEHRKYKGLPALSGADFLKMMDEKKKLVEIQDKLANRSVNEGFSGGEKKRNEIFQMAMLEPKLAILDETDSGLDIDAFLVITHYQRLLDYIVPDFVHVLFEGRIVKSGGKELALELEARGYDWIKQEQESLNS